MTTLPLFEGIRLVLFDLDGTLHHVRPTPVEAFVAYSAEMGVILDEGARRAIIRWDHEHWATNRALLSHDEEHLSREAFMEKHLRLFVAGSEMADSLSEAWIAHIVARFRDDFAPETYLAAGAGELLARLRGLGLRLGLVSNRDGPLADAAAALGILEYFDFTLSAGQVKSWKPDAAIFHHALRLGGDMPPGEAICIGDNYFADVAGARAVGMRTVLIDEAGAFPEARDECVVISRLSDLMRLLPDQSLSG